MSTFKVDTLQSTTGGVTTLTKQSAAKAWAHCDMDGDDAFQQSFNFASITDNGTGDFEFNFTNNMNYADYAIGGLNGNGTKSTASTTTNRPAVSTSSAYKFTSLASNATVMQAYNADDISAIIHGDLA